MEIKPSCHALTTFQTTIKLLVNVMCNWQKLVYSTITRFKTWLVWWVKFVSFENYCKSFFQTFYEMLRVMWLVCKFCCFCYGRELHWPSSTQMAIHSSIINYLCIISWGFHNEITETFNVIIVILWYKRLFCLGHEIYLDLSFELFSKFLFGNEISFKCTTIL